MGRRVLLDRCPAPVVITLAGLLGAVIFLKLFGLGYALGTSDFWTYPAGDAEMALKGWRYYVHDGWHWPLGTTVRANAPEGVNILFFDAIPLVAMAGKLAVPLVGTEWHPYGAWHFAVYVLQGVLGACLARTLGVRSLLGGLGAAALCLSTTAFLLRFYHVDLDAHFLLLWALVVYARGTGPAAAKIGREWALVLVLALLVQPYLAAMASLIAAAAHARLFASDRRAAVRSAAIAAASVAAAWFAVGYELRTPTPAEAAEFGHASLNVASTVLPYFSALAPQLPSPSVQDATGGQWDGHNFLGAGVLVLALVALTAGRRELGAIARRHKALAFTMALLFVYAMGTTWYVGQRALVHVPIDWLPRGALTLRATGRFFWPVGYAIALGALAVVVQRFGRRGTVLVAVMATLQLVDASATWPVIRENVTRAWTRHADWDTWQPLVASYKRLELYPSWYCWSEDPGERVLGQVREIEHMAAAAGLTTAHARTGRVVTDCARGRADLGALTRGGLDAETLYVFMRPAHREEIVDAMGAERCADFGGGWVCSAERPVVTRREVSSL